MNSELREQVERCRERLAPTWRMTWPLAGMGGLYLFTMTFTYLGKGDRLAIAAIATLVSAGAVAAIWHDRSTKRRKLERELAGADRAVLGFHDLFAGLVFVAPDGIFIEAFRGIMPFAAKPGEQRGAACSYLPQPHALHLLFQPGDVVLDISLPATITPQQAEEACRLAAQPR